MTEKKTVATDNYVKKTTRQSNLELSRILAMYLIVAHHFSVHGGVPIWSASFPLTLNYYLDQMLSVGGKVGVNLFILITGYFMIRKFTKASALAYLWIKTFSYVLFFFLLFSLLGLHPFSFQELIACFFPIRNDFYWFVSAYFMLMLLSPFLTLGINALGEKRLLAFLVLFGLMWSVIPTLTTKPEYYGSTLLWFVYMFSWGGFLRFFLEKQTVKRTSLWLILSVCTLLTALVVYASDLSNRHVDFIGYIDWFTFANLSSFFSLVASLSLFILFKQADIGYRPRINTIASAMFGVYLIHENPLVYPWLWTKVFHVPAHLENSTPLFLLYAFSVITFIFVFCTAFDLLWEKYLRGLFNRYGQNFFIPWDDKINQFFSGEAK